MACKCPSGHEESEPTVRLNNNINEVLPIALQCDDKMLGSNWTYQEDSATPHIHYLTQEWCGKHFHDFICKKRWPPNSPDLCPLDYSLWNELAQSMNLGSNNDENNAD